MNRGLVIKNTGSWYLVRLENGQAIECKIKGNFRLKELRSTNPLAVGDRVQVVLNQEGSGLITEIEDRENYIVRRSTNLSKQSHIIAANLDLCLLIVTLDHPVTSTIFIDRFLASAEAYRVPVNLVFNKTDLLSEEDMQYLDALADMYSQIGYSTFKVSALNNNGIDAIKDLIANKIVLLSGHSGVGKSTFINALLPNSNLRTGAISDYHGKGMHTTTFSEMIEQPQGGFIIDTPGIKGFGTIDMDKEEIYHYFPEIFKFSKDCRFNNCLHINEPGCAVVNAVDQHYISQSRYTSYLNIMSEDIEEKYRGGKK